MYCERGLEEYGKLILSRSVYVLPEIDSGERLRKERARDNEMEGEQERRKALPEDGALTGMLLQMSKYRG
jgi:hypothetical protein